MGNNQEGTATYKVVMNDDRQYSIWPAERKCPSGWIEPGVSGEKSECLEYIKEVWTDMRPMKLRKQMEENSRRAQLQSTACDARTCDSNCDARNTGNPLIEFLSHGDHPLMFRSREGDGVRELKEGVGRGNVLITFTDTHGGTELGLKLDSKPLLDAVDWNKGTGTVEFSGNLKLDGIAFSCLVQLNLATLSGSGKLQVLP